MEFREGEKAYIVENNLRVTPVHIAGINGDFYTVALSDHSWINLRKSRLFATPEEAYKKSGLSVPEKKPVEDNGYRSPYHYENYRSPYGI